MKKIYAYNYNPSQARKKASKRTFNVVGTILLFALSALLTAAWMVRHG